MPIILASALLLTMGLVAVVLTLRNGPSGGPSELTWGTFALLGFGMPALVGACWLWGRHNLRLSAARTCYCVTDRRVLILDNGFCGTNGPSVVDALSQSPNRTERRSLAPDDIDDFRCSERDDGSGDVILKSVLVRDSEGDKVRSEIGFYSVPRAREAEAAVRRLLDGRSKHAEPGAAADGGA